MNDFTEYEDHAGESWHVGPDDYGVMRAWPGERADDDTVSGGRWKVNVGRDLRARDRNDAWNLADARRIFGVKPLDGTSPDTDARITALEQELRDIRRVMDAFRAAMRSEFGS